MLVSVLLYFQLLSGSVFGAVFCRKRFEETLPFTFFGIVFWLFGFGCAGGLGPGWALLMILLPLLWLTAGIRLLIRGGLREAASCLLTPGFVLFTALFILLHLLNAGKLATSWDEFSHWMDSIRAMTLLDDFVSNPASASAFPSYPPGMTLFQYFVQRTAQLYEPSGFCEWRMYTAFQLFCFSVLFPLLKNLTFRRADRCAAAGIVLFLCPAMLFDSFYTTVLIDPAVGMFAGAGFAVLLMRREEGVYTDVYTACLCAMLVLLKDVGKYEAAALAAAHLAVSLIRLIRGRKQRRVRPSRLAAMLLPALGTAGAALLWQNVLAQAGTRIRFGGAMDLKEYLGLLFLHNGTDYHQQVADNVLSAFSEARFEVGVFGLRVSLLALLLGFAAVLALTAVWARKRAGEEGKEHCAAAPRAETAAVCAAAVLQALIYAFAIGAVYIANFSKGEAVSLASYERYAGIALLPVWILILFWALDLSDGRKRGRIGLCLLTAAVILLSPMQAVVRFVNGTDRQESAAFREPYDAMARRIAETCGSDADILLIVQESKGSAYYIERSLVRPARIHGPWSIGKKFYDGDSYTKKMTRKQLRQTLKDAYDYVVLYRVNDYFTEHYGPLFPDGIREGSIYRVNRDTGRLKICD